jgi:hypothetical protein
MVAKLDAFIREKVGDLVPDNEVDGKLLGINPEIPDDIFLEEHDDEFKPAELGAAMPEADDYTPEAYDEYLTAEVLLLNIGEVMRAKVVARKHDANGNPIGIRNTNPIFDTREYEVEFPDGATNVFTANMIAKSMHSQVDSNGHTFAIMGEIINHKSDGTAVSKDDGFKAYGRGQR